MGEKTGRLYFLDNLRTFVTILVIVFHVALSYGSDQGWYFHQPADDAFSLVILGFCISINQAFFMAMLFMISGYFTPGAYDRKGFGGFIKDRLLRLAIPYLVYVLAVIPVVVYFYERHFHGLDITFLLYYSQTVLKFKLLGPGPLWFALVLLVFSIFYAAFRGSLDRIRKTREVKKLPFPAGKTILLFIAGLSVATMLIRWAFPINEWFSVFNLVYLDFSHMFSYISLFFLGVLAFRNDWFMNIPKKTGITWSLVTLGAVLVWPAIMLTSGILEGDRVSLFGGLHWQSFVYSGWETLVCVGTCISLPWIFRQRAGWKNNVAKRLSGSSYTVYLIHTPVIVGIQYIFARLGLSQILNFFLISALGSAACFLTAILVRIVTEKLKMLLKLLSPVRQI
ncbi:MAG TPA: hypothetical protein DD727_07060 [Clostridiales bacterium]|nr:hypothetical protein [Clostridiales bacterium]